MIMKAIVRSNIRNTKLMNGINYRFFVKSVINRVVDLLDEGYSQIRFQRLERLEPPRENPLHLAAVERFVRRPQLLSIG